MAAWEWAVIGFGAVSALYAAFVLGLLLAGRSSDARALARFIPDCIVLVRRLIRDSRVSRRHKFLLGGLIAYLAMPIDIVPDFIPIAGQLDDAIIVTLVLRSVLRAAGPTLVREHWPGPVQSLNVVLRSAFGDKEA